MPRLPVVPDLGAYLREQRVAAHLSLRELADRAGMSNPYLSQVERGLRKPSAEILGALADALDLSAETLYVRAGILEPPERPSDVVAAITSDPSLTARQRQTLVDLYELFVNDRDDAATQEATSNDGEGEGPAAQPDAPGADADRDDGTDRAAPTVASNVIRLGAPRAERPAGRRPPGHHGGTRPRRTRPDHTDPAETAPTAESDPKETP